MATESVAPLREIKIDHKAGVGLSGLLHILMERTYKDGSDFGELSDAELLTIENQAKNVQMSYTSGLNLLGDLISGHDKQYCEIDANSTGWLVKELAEGVAIMAHIEANARFALERRGYDAIGVPIATAA